MHGVKSRTRIYRVLYTVTGPLVPLLRRLFPNQVSTTERIGRAMLIVARRDAAKRILEPPDIEALVRAPYEASQPRTRLSPGRLAAQGTILGGGGGAAFGSTSGRRSLRCSSILRRGTPFLSQSGAGWSRRNVSNHSVMRRL